MWITENSLFFLPKAWVIDRKNRFYHAFLRIFLEMLFTLPVLKCLKWRDIKAKKDKEEIVCWLRVRGRCLVSYRYLIECDTADKNKFDI